MESLSRKRYLLDDMPVDDVAETIIEDILKLSIAEKNSVVSYVNPHVFMQAKRNEKLKKSLKDADIVYPDGWGIIFALRLLGNPISKRKTAADFFGQFCRAAAARKIKIGFIGGSRTRGKKGVNVLMQQIPNLRLRWIHHGFFKREDERTIIKRINKQKLQILLVGLGTPKQEQWTQKTAQHLDVKVIWNIGGMMEYYAGRPLAPRYLGDLYLEWLFRLTTEPRRLWKRYTIENIQFGYWLLKTKLSIRNRHQES